MRNKKCNFKFIIILSFTILFLNQCTNSENTEPPDSENDENISLSEDTSNIQNIDESCSVVFAGDVLLHDAELKAGYNEASGTYNFDEFFSNVQDYIKNADLAVCNSETTYLGQGSSYSGYPSFNSPLEVLSSLKTCGFDILSSAHNHILDQGTDGFINTVKSIKNNNFDLIGIKENDDDKNYIIKDVNNIKIGITNYTYCEENENGLTINDLPLPKELENKINLFSTEHIDSYINNMEDTIENMKQDGAEFIIFYIHWGTEYETVPNEQQKYLAQKLNQLGVDVIIGSHPHVVQSINTIKNEDTNRNTLVCYSLGNFVSNQRQETIGNKLSADGLMVKLNIKKNSSAVSLASYEAQPTWVYKYIDSSDKLHYKIVKDKDVLDNRTSKDYTADVFNQIQDSYNSTENIINAK